MKAREDENPGLVPVWKEYCRAELEECAREYDKLLAALEEENVEELDRRLRQLTIREASALRFLARASQGSEKNATLLYSLLEKLCDEPVVR